MNAAMPRQDTLLGSAIRFRSFVVSSIWLSAIVLSVLDSRAEMKTPEKAESTFSAAHCHGSIAKTEWTLADGHSPTPACMVGKSVLNGVLDFDANVDQSAIIPITLPGQYKGRLTVKILWQPASTIGSVGWCVEVVTGTDLKRAGGTPATPTTRHCASDPAKKSAEHLITVLAINVAGAAASAGNEALHMRVSRDANSSVVLDDMPGDARLIGVVIESEQAPSQTRSGP